MSFKPKTWRQRSLIAFLAVGLGAGLVAWRHGHANPQEKAERVQGYISDALDLDDAQEAKLASLANEVLAVMKDMHAERGKDAPKLIAQVNGSLDKDALLAAFKQRRDLIDAKAPAVVDRLVEFHASLNNEQKAKVAAFLEKRQKRFEEKQQK